jgi:hypothetical protein
VTLTINDTAMSSDRTAHTAWYVPSRNGWEVSWLPGRTLDCNTTIPTSEPSAPPKPLAVGILSAAQTPQVRRPATARGGCRRRSARAGGPL